MMNHNVDYAIRSIERIQSYASIKQDSKNKSKLLRILGAFFILSLFINFILLQWVWSLKDSMIMHQYQNHEVSYLQKNIDSVIPHRCSLDRESTC